MWPFKRKAVETETRSSGTGYTSQILSARESYISQRTGLAELTAVVQAAVSLWEGGMALADVQGTDILSRRHMALSARSLALRGESVFLITDRGLVPAADWDLATKNGEPRAYRISISEAGGGRTMTALAAEVLHFRVGSDPVAPWTGTAPLRRSSLTAGLLNTLESALAETFENSPLGSQIVPMPESSKTDQENLSRSFRGNRGRVLLRESVNVSAAGGPAPAQDWKPSDLSPDLSRSMTKESWSAARDGIAAAFGVLPALANPAATGPLVREAQRHLAQWTLQPLAMLMSEEATLKLGTEVFIDTMRPSQAFDAGGRARALSAVVGAMAAAKEAGLTAAEFETAATLVNWSKDNADGAA